MNRPFWRWLLDLDVIPEDAASLRLVWQHNWPAWIWAALLGLAFLFAVWSYHRLSGSPLARIALAALRGMLLVFLLVLLAGPSLELPREFIEPDSTIILLDRSASMQIEDGGGTIARETRDAQLRRLLARHETMFADLAGERRVLWLGFHAGAFDLVREATGDAELPFAPDESNPAGIRLPVLDEPTGRRTRLSRSLEQALRRVAGRPLSGVVLLSDGRTTDPPGRMLLRRLQSEAVPVFVIPLGSPEPLGDLAIGRVEMPRRAFVHDKIPVIVEVEQAGSAAGEIEGVVKLVDELTGRELDRVNLADADGSFVTLTAEPDLSGETSWRVELETSQPDLIPDNDRRAQEIELLERPLRVLFVEGYPRWEYRYLKNLLIREQSIDSSVMLLSADRDFAQEGNQPITRLPRSPEEFQEFDLIVLGDVPASFFSPDQLAMIRDHVADRGAGLLWIGGARHTPSSYAGTALADLLPMGGSLNVETFAEPVTMQPTDLAQRLGILRLTVGQETGWPEALVDPGYGWSQLYGAQRVEPGRLKPAAEVLASTAQPVAGTEYPLIISMRFGAGQTIYVGTDEIWRWRYGRGELLPEQFWLQMIRMLGRESIANTTERASLLVDPKHVDVNEPVRVELHLLDAQLSSTRRASVAAVVESEDGRPLVEIELTRLDSVAERYATTYLPSTAGSLRIRLDDPSLPGMRLETPIVVTTPDDELRHPETDHDLLAELAESTGGRVLNGQTLAELPALLPKRSVKTENPLRESIWDTPLAFILVLLLLTAEWIGRKVIRLI